MWRRVPKFPGSLNHLVRKNLREIFTTLDFYVDCLLTAPCSRFASPCRRFRVTRSRSSPFWCRRHCQGIRSVCPRTGWERRSRPLSSPSVQLARKFWRPGRGVSAGGDPVELFPWRPWPGSARTGGARFRTSSFRGSSTAAGAAAFFHGRQICRTDWCRLRRWQCSRRGSSISARYFCFLVLPGG